MLDRFRKVLSVVSVFGAVMPSAFCLADGRTIAVELDGKPMSTFSVVVGSNVPVRLVSGHPMVAAKLLEQRMGLRLLWDQWGRERILDIERTKTGARVRFMVGRKELHSPAGPRV